MYNKELQTAIEIAKEAGIIMCQYFEVDGSELDYSKPFKGAVVSNGLVHKDVIEYCKEDLI